MSEAQFNYVKGSGEDGYELDIEGNGVPAAYDSSWRYFGSAIGWAPVSLSIFCSISNRSGILILSEQQVKSWQCGTSWEAPSAFLSAAGKVTWWFVPLS